VTRAEAIAYIQQGLAWRSDKSTEILAALDEAQRELEQGTSLPWFLITEAGSLSGTANDGTLTIPAGFIKETDEDALSVVTTEGITRFLRKMNWGDMILNYQDSSDGTVSTGDPEVYVVRATTIEVRPIPTATWTASLDYFAHDTLPSALASGATNDWLTEAPYVLVNLAGTLMAEDIEYDAQKPMIEKFARRYARNNAKLMAQIAEREMTNREIVMGSRV